MGNTIERQGSCREPTLLPQTLLPRLSRLSLYATLAQRAPAPSQWFRWLLAEAHAVQQRCAPVEKIVCESSGSVAGLERKRKHTANAVRPISPLEPAPATAKVALRHL